MNRQHLFCMIISGCIVVFALVMVMLKRQRGPPTRHNNKIDELKEIIKTACERDDKNNTHGEMMNKICKKVSDTKISEEKQSYTINKEKIYLCLYDKNNQYYSNNMLIYVLLHEFSHVLCKSVGHTDEFYDIFNRVLQDAVERGVYDPNIPIDETYCKHNE